MGWLFSERWLERKDLIKHLVENKGGAKVIKHCCVGNNLWLVYEYERNGRTERTVGLCMMKGPTRSKAYTGADRDWWGYKDLDESSGPNYLSCPESYLTMCTAPPNKWAYEWRQRVYALGEKRRSLKLGTTWAYNHMKLTLMQRLSPTAFRAVDEYGAMWRVRTNQLLNAVEVV